MQLSSTLFAALCSLLALSAQSVAGLAVPDPAPAVCPQSTIVGCLKPSGGSSFDYKNCSSDLQGPVAKCLLSLCPPVGGNSVPNPTCIGGLITDFGSKGQSSSVVDCVCKNYTGRK